MNVDDTFHSNNVRMVDGINVVPAATYKIATVSGTNIYVGVQQMTSREGAFLNDSTWKALPYTFTALDNANFARLVFYRSSGPALSPDALTDAGVTITAVNPLESRIAALEQKLGGTIN